MKLRYKNADLKKKKKDMQTMDLYPDDDYFPGIEETVIHVCLRPEM